MQHMPLAQVRHRIVAGQPLPFNVYRPDTRLLLARGQVLHTSQQIQTLCERGTLVDLAEMREHLALPATAPRALLPRLWQAAMQRVEEVLRNPRAPGFRAAVDEAAVPLHALIDRDPDLAIFQVLRQDGGDRTRLGAEHSVRAAVIARLVAQRLGWPEGDMQRAFKAALTMNVAMLELHGVLAAQCAPPDAVQRRQIHEHPARGRELLEAAGIVDADWLRAVAEHHEERDGSGYPSGMREPSELATLLRRADQYTAKLASRCGREAIAADRAAREIFMQDPEHPICASLVKEMGIYPPGCFVVMACGETGVVVARGATVMTPLVAAMTDVYGRPFPEPLRRDTREPTYAITGVLAAREMRAPLAMEKIAALAAD
jgi:HD-GYP domain-containing protein (c-di-GMP phosphodiesterase class II)